MDCAPVVHLHTADAYRPAGIEQHLEHIQPEVDHVSVSEAPSPLTLENLSSLNDSGGEDVYLTSADNVEDYPDWLFGAEPNSSGKPEGAVSCAVIVNDKGNGLVDAFYMYLYSFDFGGVYLDFLNVGKHVGDWEQNMIRFQDGVPQYIWYSQHSNGEAFEFDVTEKYNGTEHPVAYSANGTLPFMLSSTGDHAHAIPNLNLDDGIVEDHTEKGPIWDPTLSAYYYSYNASSETFAAYGNSTPVDWLYFKGNWGDEQYRDSDDLQKCFLDIDGLCKYTNGPTGPLDKQLDREEVCPDNGIPCILRKELGP
ncbi:hypothetical protein KC356_g5239 [Hortaea werneckii]|nr:hypothetical protein KC356_g5239 [Hortaea werneckii]